MMRIISWAEVPRARRDRIKRSRKTEGSPASIFAMRDWLDFSTLASSIDLFLGVHTEKHGHVDIDDIAGFVVHDGRIYIPRARAPGMKSCNCTFVMCWRRLRGQSSS
jgi:hypothetical protein